jgi:hypothetical protein
MNIARVLGYGLLAAMLAPEIAHPQEHPGDKSLAARVQRLEDQEEIRMLLVDYGRSLDARDFAKYASLFAKDGEWSGGHQGHDGQRNRIDACAAAEFDLPSIDQFRDRRAWRHGHRLVAMGVCNYHQGEHAVDTVRRPLRRHRGARRRPLEIQEAGGVERYSAFGEPRAD